MAPRRRKRFILSIDGGGIRGLIPARILSRLYEEMRKIGKTKELHCYFDMMVGTSTGAIIAGGLSCPSLPGGNQTAAMTPEQLEMIFREHGADIFPTEVFDALRSMMSIFTLPLARERYPTAALEKLLHEKLSDAAVSEALCDVIITGYRLDNRSTKLFSNLAVLQHRYGDFRFRDAILASAAAPTYFQPVQIAELKKNAHAQTIVDGGVFAGDPALVAYSQALALGWDDFRILSLGTGIERRHYPYDEVKTWRVMDWINPARGVPILNILMQGQAQITDIVLDAIMNKNDEVRYWKIDDDLKGVNDDMDDASPENISRMINFSDELRDKFAKAISDIADLLQERDA